MEERTVRRLLDLDRRFYERHGDAFAAVRTRPWKGWDRLLQHVRSGRDAHAPSTRPAGSAGIQPPLRVLDVGCGHGRLGRFLVDRLGAVEYVGVDRDGGLLARAREALGSAADLRRAELVTTPLGDAVPERDFDLVAAMGLLHHVPGRDRRRRLVRAMADRIAPGGILAVTVWRFDRDPAWPKKALSWNDHAECAADPVRADEVEDGDHLLTFGGDVARPRYAHLASKAEIAEWRGAVEPPLELVDAFASDGRSGRENDYLSWRRASITLHP